MQKHMNVILYIWTIYVYSKDLTKKNDTNLFYISKIDYEIYTSYLPPDKLLSTLARKLRDWTMSNVRMVYKHEPSPLDSTRIVFWFCLDDYHDMF